MRSFRAISPILIAFFLLTALASCNDETPAPVIPTPAPTWTPTGTASPIRKIVASPALQPSPTRPPAPTSLVAAPTPTTYAAPTPTARQRIDAAGPTPIATMAPLPPGQGRSPVRIRIPVIGLDARVQPMHWRLVGGRSEWVVPDNAAGHHIDSAFPGEAGNVVISGHHNIRGRVFAQLSRIGEPGARLEPGDEVVLEDELGRRFVYRITGWQRIPEANASIALRLENASYLLPTDFPQLTLITCWPADSNTHRVIIQAVLTEIHTP